MKMINWKGFNFSWDTITLLLLIGLIILIVFLLADYKTFKRFIKKDKNRCMAFTESQANNYQDEEIASEVVEEFVEEIVEGKIDPSRKKEE